MATATWPLGEVDKLIESTLATDATIKSLMGITGSSKARVAGYRIPRDPAWGWFIYFYSIPGPGSRVNGNKIIQYNPDYDIEVRTIGAPTDDSEAAVDRVYVLMNAMKKTSTPGGLWVVSAVFRHEITIIEQGETNEVYYTRRGGSYRLAVVRSSFNV